MNYRNFILGILVIALAFAAGCTQTTDHNEPAQENLTLSQSELNLITLTATDHFDLAPEQREQINALMKKHQEAIQALIEEHKKGNVTRDELQSGIQTMEQELEEQIKLILTPEQFEKWKQHQEYMKQFGGLPYPLIMPLDQLIRVLELNEQQVQRARAIVDQALRDMRAAAQSINDKDRLRFVMGEILKRADLQFRTILNEQQRIKYDQLKHKQQAPLPYPLILPLDQLARALALTPEQIALAKGIVEDAMKEIRFTVENVKDKEALRKALEAIIKRTDEAFRALLTQEQSAKYDQIKKTVHQQHYPYPLILPLEVLAKDLALNREQIQKANTIIQAAMLDIRRAVDTIKDKDELQKVVEQIKVRSDAQFKSILNAQQIAKYEEIKKKIRASNG